MVLTESDYLNFNCIFKISLYLEEFKLIYYLNPLSLHLILSITNCLVYGNIVGNCVSANGNDIKAIHVMKSKQVLLI